MCVPRQKYIFLLVLILEPMDKNSNTLLQYVLHTKLVQSPTISYEHTSTF